ncbi:hypothetical protein A6A05_05650 [Magnetospirillum moscoviense]|uniref:CRISPR-associated endonuclease Cas9 n=1 Tax=Magnetospirillum moscoviense TaxID=1437059 RepID=A0A178N1Y8_9PROT|nr:hypothetical protein A6A05_05650 [Magnetospirillum moscoviense]
MEVFVDVSARQLGIDLGIGTCGWALLAEDSLIALGTRTFDVPETDKERIPTNQIRRQARGMRRVIDRRRQRMNAVRRLLADHGLLADGGKLGLATVRLDPWQARAEGLDRLLSAGELAVALGHIAKHRGFRSNSKRDRGANAPKESSAMLGAIAQTGERLQHWRTVGEMFWKDEFYQTRRRNRDGDYSRTVQRLDLETEVHRLLAAQRRLGNPLATFDLEQSFIDVAFFQRPLADSDDKVGPCPFEPSEKRAARHSPSFERFRLLSRLAALRLSSGAGERPLSDAEFAAACADFGRLQGFSFKRLRQHLKLDPSIRFAGIAPDEEGKRDVVARSGEATPGSAALRHCLGDTVWDNMLGTRPALLDAIAAILTFRDDADRIAEGLAGLGIEEPILDALMDGVRNGSFGKFKGPGHISAKACRALLPHLARGRVYSDACADAGYDHSRQTETNLDDIRNPVARKALGEALKQIKIIIHTHGRPTAIHVEMARDIGKSADERDEIKKGIDKRNSEKDRARQQFHEMVGTPAAGAEDLLRFELWKEQNGWCLYTGREIPIDALVSSDNRIQVDHILPWSRSGDDSYINKTLCFTEANQHKKGMTPWEWLHDDPERWEKFARTVEGCKTMKGRKKRNLLLRDSSRLEKEFRSRNLNDTRYACRLLLGILKHTYPDIVVAARPGPLTDRLRRAWGLQSLKKHEDGTRKDDDRHHALDAAVVAATSQSMLQRLTTLFQKAEREGGRRDFVGLEPPWPGFRADLEAKLEGVVVSRAERRRARGAGHKDTIRAIGEGDAGPVVYERKPVAALTEKDLDRVKDPERNKVLIENLRQWIAAGKPKDPDKAPRSPKGDPMTKVKLVTTDDVRILVRGGTADRGDMARVDVFRQADPKGRWRFFLVPVYPHQVFDPTDWPQPPNRAVVAYKPEKEWTVMGPDHEFLWSLYPFSWIAVEKADGTRIEGYFRGMHRSTGAISISPHHSKSLASTGIGAKTLASFRKFAMDRMGNLSEIEREVRTWHGVACT